MKTAERVTFRFGMILGPLPMDESWRRRKLGRDLGKIFKGAVIGTAGMLLLVYIGYWLVQP